MATNAWCELVTDEWFWANQAWERKAEKVALGYETELAEYKAENPRPQLRDFMIELSQQPGPDDEVVEVEPGQVAA